MPDRSLSRCYSCRSLVDEDALASVELVVFASPRRVSLCLLCLEREGLELRDPAEVALWRAELTLVAAAAPYPDATERELETHHRVSAALRCPIFRGDVMTALASAIGDAKGGESEDGTEGVG